MLQNVLNTTYFHNKNHARIINFSAAKAVNDFDNKLGQIADEISKANNICLMAHKDPDCDAGASVLAVLDMIKKRHPGKQVDIYINGNMPKSLKKFEDVKKIIHLNNDKFDKEKIKEYDLAIALDSQRLDLLSESGAAIFNNAARTIKIDHHPKPNKGFANIELIDSTAKSTTQILIKLADKMNISIEKNLAKLLFSGIVSDSSGFSNLSTNSAKTFEACARLAKTGINTGEIYADVINHMTRPMFEYYRKILNNVHFTKDGRIVSIQESRDFLKNLPQKIKDDAVGRSKVLMEIGTTILLNIEGVKVSMRAMPTKDDIGAKIILRGNGIPVNRVAQYFNGGGHPIMAGCEIENKTIPNAVKKVINYIQTQKLLDKQV